ncbi:MAG: hypothetical protein KAU20_07880 [Nanoarchaeota archaeon]|nr:hypothetical protein [Nanoarchaeota archaeon]
MLRRVLNPKVTGFVLAVSMIIAPLMIIIIGIVLIVEEASRYLQKPEKKEAEIIDPLEMYK